MKRSISRGIAVVAVALLYVFSATAIGAEDRPLTLKGTSVIAGDPFAKGGAPFSTTGTGTHLGDFAGEGKVFFKQRKDGILGTGTVTFTSASGDQLFTSFSGILDETGHATIEFDILGGTSRFEDATGSFIADAQAQPDGATFTFTAEGTITY
jgi:hypothetical protein